MSTTQGRGLGAFPQATHARFERERKETTLAPYRHADSGRAPQAEFLAAPAGMGDVVSDAGTHAFVSGLGAGKTTALILRAWVNAEKWNPGELGMLVAPTVPALKNVVLPEMRSLGLLDVCEYHGPGSERPGIHTPSGSRIILESADNERKIDRLRGPNLAWFGMDEPRSIPEQAWDVLSGRLRVGQYRNAFTTTTPAGRNWVWKRFYDDEDRDVRYKGIYEWVTANDCNGVFGVPSWLNPHNPDDYFDRLKREYSGAFYKQEVEGEFTKFEGLVYPWFDADNHIPHDDRPESEQGEYDEVIYGVDWGFRNPAVVLAIVRQGDRWVVVDEFYESRCTDEDHADVAERFGERWGPGVFYCDPSEPSNIETFRRRGLNARPAENDVIPGLQHVAGMQDSLRVVDSCQAVINEFGQYQYKDSDEKDDPVKQNDHAMDALRYALFTHDNVSPLERRRGSAPSKGSMR